MFFFFLLNKFLLLVCAIRLCSLVPQIFLEQVNNCSVDPVKYLYSADEAEASEQSNCAT
jgi:hypothetical protein